jgi:Mlc titration factor MtfA (ptsG expression regulator)
MENLLVIFAFTGLIIFALAFIIRPKKIPIIVTTEKKLLEILSENVDFYEKLSFEKKKEFKERSMKFLACTRITGVGTTVEDLDKVLIAASAIIPIFGFPGWEYPNLKEVLLYPEHFDDEFKQTGQDRNILGMVGNGPYNNVMILSQRDLREAFYNKTAKSNTAIHEFVHLMDKSDGVVDGLPEIFLDKKYIIPWVKLIREEMEKIAKNDSDINPYAITNEGEFFAVVSEYFFERPDLLEEKHPQLYKQLSSIFQQRPSTKG